MILLGLVLVCPLGLLRTRRLKKPEIPAKLSRGPSTFSGNRLARGQPTIKPYDAALIALIVATEQPRKFTETSGDMGIVLGKLDRTAKGDIVVAIAPELNVPIRYLGVGEKMEDLLPIDAEKFIESLFEK